MLLYVSWNVVLVATDSHLATLQSVIVLVELGLEEVFDLLTSHIQCELCKAVSIGDHIYRKWEIIPSLYCPSGRHGSERCRSRPAIGVQPQLSHRQARNEREPHLVSNVLRSWWRRGQTLGGVSNDQR